LIPVEENLSPRADNLIPDYINRSKYYLPQEYISVVSKMFSEDGVSGANSWV